jgi:hypothetical protein
VPNANHPIGTNLAKTSEKRYKDVGIQSLVGREGLGPSTLRLIGGSSTGLNYRPTWGDASVLSDFSLSQAGCSRSHELTPHLLKGGLDSRLAPLRSP